MTQGHEQPSTLHEIAYYPPHGPRDTDPNYRIFHSARHHLIDVLNVGCWIGPHAHYAVIEDGRARLERFA